MFDIVVIGAGPVGATLALALADADLNLVLVDSRAHDEAGRSERTLALSHGARLIFERVGIWGPLAATRNAVTPIVEVDVSQAQAFGATRLTAADAGVPALGYVVSYRALQAALDAALARRAIPVRFGATAERVGGTPAYAAVTLKDYADAITARLAVVADGVAANVEGIERDRRPYDQTAIVAPVWPRAPHGGVAFERFTPHGPIALLPQGDRYGLVWTRPPADVPATLALSDEAFMTALATHFGARVSFARVGERRAFPLALEFARPVATTRVATIGNAAQSLHPIAGQGFNLGLRDAFELSRVVIDTPKDAIGDRAMLDRYVRERRTDRWAGIAFTHGLVHFFAGDLELVRWPRGLALSALDAFPQARRAFTRAMLFGLR
jgi:2-octaprenyl-6-methoxyphenol hydroxylase